MKTKQIVVISDMHLETGENIHNSYNLVKKYIKSIKPEQIIINGDALDFSYISSFNKDAELLRENKRLSDDIIMFRKELDFFEKYSKKVKYFEGNHEFRLTKLNEKFPNFTAGLLTLPKLLNIDYYIPEVEQPIEILPDLYAMHGKRYGMHVASATVKDYMENIIIGHTHRIQTYAIRTLRRTVTGYNCGCLCDRAPKYLNGRMNQHNNGFIVIEYDNNGWNINNIIIEKDSFICNGKRWSL